jgi:hypothetical protein
MVNNVAPTLVKLEDHMHAILLVWEPTWVTPRPYTPSREAKEGRLGPRLTVAGEQGREGGREVIQGRVRHGRIRGDAESSPQCVGHHASRLCPL